MTEPSDYRYTRTHEWIRREGDVATVGITDHAQRQLGDVIYVELPEVGTELQSGQKFGAVESVKAASDLYAPVAGRVTEVNSGLSDAPEKVNADAQGEGWMIKLGGVTDNPELLDEEGYRRLVGAKA